MPLEWFALRQTASLPADEFSRNSPKICQTLPKAKDCHCDCYRKKYVESTTSSIYAQCKYPSSWEHLPSRRAFRINRLQMWRIIPGEGAVLISDRIHCCPSQKGLQFLQVNPNICQSWIGIKIGMQKGSGWHFSSEIVII